ncbi:MAG: DUF429 domain-containing protein [Thermoplasmata archaeon]|nr:MAG: DUF429 domain-containing protein [Thermoplasmata archaeon]
MIAVGIDLAGKEKNPTGLCSIFRKEGCDEVMLSTLYRDKDIVEYANSMNPDIVAIDAPLIEGEIKIREGDRILKKYGALPPTLPSMRELSMRGRKIAGAVDAEVIEVFPTASAKILGFYSREYKNMASSIGIKAKNRHEVDAYIAALTGILHLEGKTEMAGEIAVPAKLF